jgi:hypothetical protein
MQAVHGNSSDTVDFGLIKVYKEREYTNYISEGKAGIYLVGRMGPNTRTHHSFDDLKSPELPGELL